MKRSRPSAGLLLLFLAGPAINTVCTAQPAVTINEWLVNTDSLQMDFVELFNSSGAPVNLSGWSLSSDAMQVQYIIPNGTVIPPGGFLAFDSTQTGFAFFILTAVQHVWLFEPGGALIDFFAVGGQLNGASQGRWPNGGPNIYSLAPSRAAQNQPLAITSQPQDQSVELGGTAAFGVGAAGLPPLGYQWRFNGAAIPGATQSVLVVPHASCSDRGSYSVMVSNSSGFVNSAVAQLVVGLPVVNASFEADTFSVFPGYVTQNGPITGWSALGGHGVNPGTFGSPFADNGAIPDGTKVAFLQTDGALSQVVKGFVPGKQYYVQYFENARNCCSGTAPFLEVKVAGNTVVAAHALLPVGGANPFHEIVSAPFIASASALEIAFIKSSPQGGDATALIDNICVVRGETVLCQDFNNGVPPGLTLFGDARVEAGRLKLYTVPQTNGFGIVYLNDFGGGEMVQAFRATFQAALFGSTCCGLGGTLPADGFSFNLVPASSVLANPGYNQPGEEGLDQGLAVNFDTWDSGGGEAPAVEVKWLGQLIARAPFQASQSPAGIADPVAASRPVVIELKTNGRLDVSYGGTLVLHDVATPYDPAVIGPPQWVLGARVGGANDNFWFDDLCLATKPATGRPIPRLFNTGVNSLGEPLLDNATDPHYGLTLGGTSAFAATEAGGFPIPPWLGSNALSAWISPTLNTFANSDGAGTYNYRYETTFDLSGFNPASARLTGRWATDNQGLDILINGISTVQSNTAQFPAWTPFQITQGFVAGINRLTFVVNNGDPSASGTDPTGLRVEVWGAAQLFAFSPCLLKFDYFNNIGGTSVSALTADPRYPNRPTASYLMTSFNSRTVFPDDSHENYGAHITGVFVPPISGNWIFYLKSDDASRFYLNPDGVDPARAMLLAEETGCCNAFSAHASAPQALTEGHRYFIEALLKEGNGGDFIQVAVKRDTDATNPDLLPPIPGAWLGVLSPSPIPDTTPPVIACPRNLGSECTSPSGTPMVYTASAVDNCDSNVTVTCTPPSGSRFPSGISTVSCATVDAAGNRASCTFTVTILDTTPPVIACPRNLGSECTSPSGTPMVYTASAVDNCDSNVAVSCAPPSGSRFPLGTTTVSCGAVDAAGNRAACTFAVTILDTTPPIIFCPPSIGVECTNAAGNLLSYSATATDNCDTNLDIVCTPPSGTRFTRGVTTVVCTATDDATNRATCTFAVTVRDTTPPVLFCPQNIGVECTNAAGNLLSYSATATDNCDTNLDIVCTPPSGTRFTRGVTTVTCTATDDATNRATCIFTVTIRDTTPPVIVCPRNLGSECASPSGTPMAYTANVVDNCDSNPTVTCTPPSGSRFPLGTTTVSCGAIDAAGNRASCTFTVTILDATPPAIVCPTNLVRDCARPSGTPVNYRVTATDNCDTNLTVNCHPPSGSLFPRGTTTVTCTATDASANLGRCSFTVTVRNCFEIDRFQVTGALTLRRPDGGDDLQVRLTGQATVAVALDSLGDQRANGQEEIRTELLAMNLTETGGQNFRLMAGSDNGLQASLGQIEELQNLQVGRLDLPGPDAPFCTSPVPANCVGAQARSAFDVRFALLYPSGLALHPPNPLHLETLITEKPPTATYTPVLTNPLELLDETGKPTGVKVVTASFTFAPLPPGTAMPQTTFCDGFNSGVPLGLTLFGQAEVDGGFLKLLNTQPDQPGIAYVDDFGGGEFIKAFRATFRVALFRASGLGFVDPGGDRFSFNLVPAATVPAHPDDNQPGEEGWEQGLSVDFGIYDDFIGGSSSVHIKWLGQIIAQTSFAASQSPSQVFEPAEAMREVVLELKTNGRLDVSYGGHLLLNDVLTPYDPAAIRAPKWVLGASRGALFKNCWFDNLCLTTLPAPGRQIPGLYNTGVDERGTPLPDDAVDPHYRLTSGGTAAFAVTESGAFPIPPWLGSNSMSAWVSPSLDTLALGDGPTTYNYAYQTLFDLTGLNPATARLAGRWTSDNRGVDILINGISTTQANGGDFTAWTPFQITNGFVAGTNRLTFVVNNGTRGTPAGVDPTGLRAEVWGAALLDCALVPSAPQLSIARQVDDVLLSWHHPGYVVQVAQHPSGPWFDLTLGISVNGRDHTATLSTEGSRLFFRLRLDCERLARATEILANVDVRYPGSLPNGLEMVSCGAGFQASDVISTSGSLWGSAASITAGPNSDPSSPGFGLDCTTVRYAGPPRPDRVDQLVPFGGQFRYGAEVNHQEVWWTINGQRIFRSETPQVDWSYGQGGWLVSVANPTRQPIYVYGCRFFPVANNVPTPTLSQLNTSISPATFGAGGWTSLNLPDNQRVFSLPAGARISLPVASSGSIVFQIAARDVPEKAFPLPPGTTGPDANDFNGEHGTKVILTTRPTP